MTLVGPEDGKQLQARQVEDAFGISGDARDVEELGARALSLFIDRMHFLKEARETIVRLRSLALPDTLCGAVDGNTERCVFLKLHEGRHSWEQ